MPADYSRQRQNFRRSIRDSQYVCVFCLSLSVCVCVCRSVCLCQCVCVSVDLSVSLSARLLACQYARLYVYCVSEGVSLIQRLTVCLSVCLSVYKTLCINPFVRMYRGSYLFDFYACSVTLMTDDFFCYRNHQGLNRGASL